MEIHDGSHVRPAALDVPEVEHQSIHPLLRSSEYVIKALSLWTYLE